ncbi:hypothetical protein DYB36_001151 [Aphanomyces astaci]|uniref:aminomethyltransferase n=1 Tax=Aphanomyces astaci TaxID=112090 RepID=A0A397AK02_APHAT|nr:hypothetical protein DYB36_001151 [Aphanomyces astaci]
MLSRQFRHVVRTQRHRQATSRRLTSDAKAAEAKVTEGKAAETATESKAAEVKAAATETPTPLPGFFSRHPEIVFLAGLVGIGGYIYRSSLNNKKFNEVQNDLAEKTPISPYEAYELRSQNAITYEVFDAVKKQAKRYFPSNEATVAEFDLCLGSVLQGTAMKNTHHLERVLLSLPKNINGKIDVDLLLVAFSLAVKGSVDERLESLFALPLAAKLTGSSTLTKAQVEHVLGTKPSRALLINSCCGWWLGHVLDTYQIPSEKRVVALEDKAYPYQEYAIATPGQILDAAVATSVKAKTLDEGTEQFNLDQFALLMKSKAVCMVDFAGYYMPVQYPAGILKSHNHTRTKGLASLFDVSHMGQLKITGKDRVRFLESIVVGDIAALTSGEAKLSLITNDKGGIIDDCVTTAYDDHLYVVVNAGNQDLDWAHMQTHLAKFQGDVKLEKITDRSLVALQGPGAAEIVSALLPASVNLADSNFMTGQFTHLLGADVILTRCGYTGEDGFEVSVPSSQVESFTRQLLADERVLRLEAGLCLHGHDISPETTPIEGALAWTMSKRRREEGGFPGADIILDQLNNKTFTKKRVGFTVEGAPAREGAEVFNPQGERIGTVTSGTLSPTLKQALGMMYVTKGNFKIGTEVHFKVRNKVQKGKVAKMPFVEPGYYKKD